MAVKRIRLEASASTEKEVNDALSRAARELAKLFGGQWLTDQAHPPQVQTTAKGYWGMVWLVRQEAMH